MFEDYDDDLRDPRSRKRWILIAIGVVIALGVLFALLSSCDDGSRFVDTDQNITAVDQNTAERPAERTAD